MRKILLLVTLLGLSLTAQAGDYVGIGMGSASLGQQWSSGAGVSYAHTFTPGVGVAVDYLSLGATGHSLAGTVQLYKPMGGGVSLFAGAGVASIGATGITFNAGVQLDGSVYSVRLTAAQSRIPGASTVNALTGTMGYSF